MSARQTRCRRKERLSRQSRLVYKEDFDGIKKRKVLHDLALAAYNAGLGHVRDARALARRLGRDPDRRHDNVEHAIGLLAQRKFYAGSTYGYVRGAQTARYVRAVRDRYKAYTQILASDEGS